MKIGIDFGTCYSWIAVLAGAKPAVAPFEELCENNAGIPSAFLYANDGRELFGIECSGAIAAEQNSEIVRDMKRIVRKNPKDLNKLIYSNNKAFALKDILEKYLRYLVKEAIEKTKAARVVDNTNLEAITITVPVGLKSGQMLATGAGGSILGFGAGLFIVDDPIKNIADAESKVKQQRLSSP